MANSSYVLRTLYIDPILDERLKREAYVANISKNELIRKYLEIGISSVDSGRHPRVSNPVPGFNDSDASPLASSVAHDVTLLRKVGRSVSADKIVARKVARKAAKKSTAKVAKRMSAKKAVKRDLVT